MSLTSRLFDAIHGWLSRPRGFFEPRSLEVGVFYARDGERLMVEFEDPMPRVILITDRLLRQWDPESPSLEELDYVEYDRSFSMRATYYARKPWVYLIKATLWLKAQCWRFVPLTYGRLWHSDPWTGGYEFKWRNIRLGPGAAARARAYAADLRVQVDAQYKEIKDLKEAKDASYGAGMDSGWRQHAQVVERYIDDMQKAKG